MQAKGASVNGKPMFTIAIDGVPGNSSGDINIVPAIQLADVSFSQNMEGFVIDYSQRSQGKDTVGIIVQVKPVA